MSTLKIAIVTAAAIGCTVAARANAPAGDACAAKLTADGKSIYAATMAAKPTTETVRPTVEKEARSLVMGGKIARGSARDNAVAAGECVKAALQ